MKGRNTEVYQISSVLSDRNTAFNITIMSKKRIHRVQVPAHFTEHLVKFGQIDMKSHPKEIHKHIQRTSASACPRSAHDNSGASLKSVHLPKRQFHLLEFFSQTLRPVLFELRINIKQPEDISKACNIRFNFLFHTKVRDIVIDHDCKQSKNSH